MTDREKTMILLCITSLAEKLNIKNDELSTTENLTNKFNKILEENKNIFNNEDELKQEIKKMFKKYVNKLSKKGE